LGGGRSPEVSIASIATAKLGSRRVGSTVIRITIGALLLPRISRRWTIK
jgi:hypothetical protein